VVGSGDYLLYGCDEMKDIEWNGEYPKLVAELEQQLAECQATNKTFYYEKGMATIALDTMLKQAKREALLEAADYVDTFAISIDTPVTAIAWHIRRMAKELET
jgi:hypothetical protein